VIPIIQNTDLFEIISTYLLNNEQNMFEEDLKQALKLEKKS